MLNGRWTIDGPQPDAKLQQSSSCLPHGAIVQLQVLGPTRLAIEEGRSNELGGQLTLIPPFPNALCSSDLGTRVCHGGRPIEPTEPAGFDAKFVFFRWSRKQAEDPSNFFFAAQGAKRGAHFLLIIIADAAVELELWMRHHDELIGQCMMISPTAHTRSDAQIWRRSVER